MPCDIIRDGQGTPVGFVCGGRRRGKKEPCFVRDCIRHGEVLCDYVVARPRPDRKAVTCDRLCCRNHARRVGKDKDYCLEHFLKERDGK